MLAMKNAAVTRHELLTRLAVARIRTDRLFALVKPDALYERPVAERHRLVFYFGHLEAFDWNLFRNRLPGPRAFAPEFDRLFAFGIDPVGGGLPDRHARGLAFHRGDPPLQPAGARGARCDTGTRARIHVHARGGAAGAAAQRRHRAPPDARRDAGVPAPSVAAGAKVPAPAHAADRSPRRSRPAWSRFPRAPSPSGCLATTAAASAGITNLTTSGRGARLCHRPLPDQQRRVPRVHDGGRLRGRALWSESDWRWRTEQDIGHPPSGPGATTAGITAACSSSCHCRCTGPSTSATRRRAPTPAGPARPCRPRRNGSARRTARRTAAKEPTRGATHRPAPVTAISTSAAGTRSPVGAFPENRSAFGVAGLLGNGWEWTATRLLPSPGFAPFACYPGYSADFFDGKHYVMKGGSARTAACCCAARSATGSSRTIRTSSRGSAASSV